MPRAVVLSAVRTPIGRYGGALSGVRPDDLAGVAIAAAVERAGVDGAAIEDVYFGCANQAGEDNRNVARMGALLAGLPGLGRRRHAEPALRIGALGRRLRVPRGAGRRCRRRRRRRRRVDEPRAARHGQAGRGLPARQPDRCGTRRSAGASRTRGSRRCSRSSRWARRARTSPSVGASRGRNRTRSRSGRSSAGRRRRRRVASTTSSSRWATSRSTSIRGRRRLPRRSLD